MGNERVTTFNIKEGDSIEQGKEQFYAHLTGIKKKDISREAFESKVEIEEYQVPDGDGPSEKLDPTPSASTDT